MPKPSKPFQTLATKDSTQQVNSKLKSLARLPVEAASKAPPVEAASKNNRSQTSHDAALDADRKMLASLSKKLGLDKNPDAARRGGAIFQEMELDGLGDLMEVMTMLFPFT